ncbi:hypothetical protein GCM10009821_11490 [Aeromicrobium halocynthiae]|uniref:Amine oxidase domain-containing protein n=1 Tax=Aeromicrobium halocynthiae TaxID=560557 RepID=A0ABN2VVM3_9ACTN
MASIVVVGAGLSGVVCARELVAAGHEAVLRDRGRRPGGRMALRRHDERVVDIGAGYFTVRDDAFAARVDDWQERGLARPWTDTFGTWSPEDVGTTTGPMRWAAPGGLRSLVQDLAAGLDVRSAAPVERVTVVGAGPSVDGEAVDAVALALPDPQARPLLEVGSPAHEALDDPYEPAHALTAGWERRTWSMPDALFVNDHPDLAFVADDGRRRGDDAPVLVAHSTADRSRRHLTDPLTAAEPMLAALREVVDAPAEEPTLIHVQRWTYSRPVAGHGRPFHLGDDLVGACGDSWGETSSIETAFLSGRALGRALVERLG